MRLAAKLIIFIALTAIAVGVWPGHGMAATGVIYLSPSSTKVQKGNNVTISLRINPGTSVDSVQATVHYSQTYLQFVSSALGVFSTCTVNSGGGGTVQFACAKLGGSTSSDSLIANITLKALAGSGSTALSVTNANAARSGSWTNPSSSGGTVSFTSPDSSSTGTAGSGSGSSSSASSNYPGATATTTTAAEPASKKTKPKPVKITAETGKAQFHSASVKLTLSTPSPAYVAYGTDKSKLDQKTKQKKTGKSASVVLLNLAPATTYYYQAVAGNPSGKASKSAVGTLTTRGFTVNLTVLDARYQPLAGKQVALHTATLYATANSQGMVTFNNVAPGLHHITYSDGGRDYSQTVYVYDNVVENHGNETAAMQNFAAILSGYIQPTGHRIKPAGFALALVGIIAAAWLIRQAIRWYRVNHNRISFKGLKPVNPQQPKT